VATVSSPDFWESLYGRPRQPWDLGGPTPGLVDFVEGSPPPRGRVAVPGCGRGYDVRYLRDCGYAAVGFDFSPRVVTAARALARIEGVSIDIEQRDVFQLGGEYPAAFDGVWEYTCYCAIDPARRAEYVSLIDTILKPGGWFLACFFPTEGAWVPPPFPVDREEVRRLLEPGFRIEREFEPPRSPAGRQGFEWMVYAVNRTSARERAEDGRH
jgi:hypothetical protein